MRCHYCHAENLEPAAQCPVCAAILPSPLLAREERKLVSVLFADVRGSLDLIHGRDPEEAREMLDPVLALMAAAVERFGGQVLQTLGDGIMAVFGVPRGQEDHAVCACHAALTMRDAAAEYATVLRDRHGVVLAIRVGLNSGEVLFRDTEADGTGQAREPTASGEAVHLAARMEQMARPGTVRITAATLRLAQGHVEVRPLGPQRIKGLPLLVPVFDSSTAVSGRPRLRITAAKRGGLTPFIGRSAEMRSLTTAMRRAAEGHGQVVALVGEAGCGKSRIVYQAAKRASAEGFEGT